MSKFGASMKLGFCLFMSLWLLFSYSNFQETSIVESEFLLEKQINLKEILNGYWKAEEEENLIIGFQDTKLSVIRDGNLQQIASIEGYKTDEVLLCIRGNIVNLAVRIEGEKLQISCSQTVPCKGLKLGDNSRFQKMDEVSQSFKTQAIVLGTDVKLSKKQIVKIQTEMKYRGNLEQKVRKKKQVDFKKIKQIDRDNTNYLIKLVEKIGWIDSKRFGKRTSIEAFLIVQHSGNVGLMMAALPKLKEDGQLNSYALVYDRLQLMIGKKQLYGSQLSTSSEGEAGLMPLEDPENVDKLRKEVGLEPLAQYIKNFGLKEVKVFDWNCDK